MEEEECILIRIKIMKCYCCFNVNVLSLQRKDFVIILVLKGSCIHKNNSLKEFQVIV